MAQVRSIYDLITIAILHLYNLYLHHIIYTAHKNPDRSGKRTPMDQAAKSRIMSHEYKSNEGKATDWSKRAQRAADRNEYHARQSGSQQESESGWWCVIL